MRKVRVQKGFLLFPAKYSKYAPRGVWLCVPGTTAGVLPRHLEVDDGPDSQPVKLLDQTLFQLTCNSNMLIWLILFYIFFAG